MEVAVDPEMLGKVFEELVTNRHGSGSYYTPKPIVSFMCREALKGYLNQVSGELPDAIAQFVDEHESVNLGNPEAILEALRRVCTCDLAAGSGAYLLGMLHELLDLRQCLFNAKKLDTKTTYQRKLEIIENNVYGVDIDPFAVNIARLRLWLSLAVEYEGDNPPPLPNLKYKIEVGDSLIAPSPTKTGAIRDELISQYRQAKARYLRAHQGGEKKKLEEEISGLKTQISLMTHGSSKVSGFDWAVEFAEVFADGGFDVVVANPPYVRMELFKEIKPTLKKNFPEIHSERADLYCYFYRRALELLRSGGMLAFISSNKWFRAQYGEKLRKHIAETCNVHSITDFGELPVFQSAATFPMIFIAQTIKTANNSTIFTQVKSLESPYPNLSSLIREKGQKLPSDALNSSNWTLTDTDYAILLRKMESVGTPLNQYEQGKIFRGIVSGCNKAFYIDGAKRAELIAQNSKSAEIIKPLVVGDNVRKWRVELKNKYLLYMHHGIEVTGLDAVIEHLKPYRRQLENRATRQEWYELQQPQLQYISAFGQPKIIYPEIAKESRFTLDTKGFLPNNKAFIIPGNDLYLLGVLNSASVWKYLKNLCSVLGDANKGGRLELRTIYISKLPIPNASITEREAISKLVQNCLDAKGVGCEAWEKEIDDRVAALYGL